MSSVSDLGERQQRVVGALVGAAVADAAATPLHWIYKRGDMETLLGTGRHPEFWPVSQSPFYSVPTGSRSCYNHVVEVGLVALVDNEGQINVEKIKQELRRKFGPNTDWQASLAARKEVYSPGNNNRINSLVRPWLSGIGTALEAATNPVPY